MNLDESSNSDPKGVNKFTYDRSAFFFGNYGFFNLDQLDEFKKPHLEIIECWLFLKKEWNCFTSNRPAFTTILTPAQKELFDGQIYTDKDELVLTTEGYKKFCTLYSKNPNMELLEDKDNMIFIGTGGYPRLIDSSFNLSDLRSTIYKSQIELKKILLDVAAIRYDQNHKKGLKYF